MGLTGFFEGDHGDGRADGNTNTCPCTLPGWTTQDLHYIVANINWSHVVTPQTRFLLDYTLFAWFFQYSYLFFFFLFQARRNIDCCVILIAVGQTRTKLPTTLVCLQARKKASLLSCREVELIKNLGEWFKSLHPATQIAMLGGITAVLVVIALHPTGEQTLMDLAIIISTLRAGKSLPPPAKEDIEKK